MITGVAAALSDLEAVKRVAGDALPAATIETTLSAQADLNRNAATMKCEDISVALTFEAVPVTVSN